MRSANHKITLLLSTVMIRAKFKLVQVGGLVSEWCCGWVGSWVDGLIDHLSPQLELGFGAELSKRKILQQAGAELSQTQLS